MASLFFALVPDRETRAAIAEAVQRIRAVDPRGRWVAPVRWHLTLAFLGRWPEIPAEAVARAQNRAGAAWRPPGGFELDRVGHFAGGVLWLGPSTTPPTLRQLAATLAAGTTGDDRPWVPHVTLARGAPARDRPLAPIPWDACEFVLLSSHGQGTYQEHGRWPR